MLALCVVLVTNQVPVGTPWPRRSLLFETGTRTPQGDYQGSDDLAGIRDQLHIKFTAIGTGYRPCSWVVNPAPSCPSGARALFPLYRYARVQVERTGTLGGTPGCWSRCHMATLYGAGRYTLPIGITTGSPTTVRGKIARPRSTSGQQNSGVTGLGAGHSKPTGTKTKGMEWCAFQRAGRRA